MSDLHGFGGRQWLRIRLHHHFIHLRNTQCLSHGKMRCDFIRRQRTIEESDFIHSPFEPEQRITATSKEDLFTQTKRWIKLTTNFRLRISVEIHGRSVAFTRKDNMVPCAGFQNRFADKSVIAFIAVEQQQLSIPAVIQIIPADAQMIACDFGVTMRTS